MHCSYLCVQVMGNYELSVRIDSYNNLRNQCAFCTNNRNGFCDNGPGAFCETRLNYCLRALGTSGRNVTTETCTMSAVIFNINAGNIDSFIRDSTNNESSILGLPNPLTLQRRPPSPWEVRAVAYRTSYLCTCPCQLIRSIYCFCIICL